MHYTNNKSLTWVIHIHSFDPNPPLTKKVNKNKGLLSFHKRKPEAVEEGYTSWFPTSYEWIYNPQ